MPTSLPLAFQDTRWAPYVLTSAEPPCCTISYQWKAFRCCTSTSCGIQCCQAQT